MKRIALILAGTCLATVLFASGDFDIGPFFKPGAFPDNEDSFRHGQLALLTPALNKVDEFVAFRYLSGLTLDGTDAINVAPPSAGTPGDAAAGEIGVQAWMNARGSVFSALTPIFPPFASIPFNTYKKRQSSSRYVSYENCLLDAFVTAARTLRDRQQQYASKSVFRDWIHAQDQVFANCSAETPVYPADPAPDLPQLARADRMYQIAAAHFYAEDLQTAKNLFTAIAQNQNSPWQTLGAYMVGRTLLREVSLKKNTADESAAQQAFQKIVDDPSAGSLRESARGLLRRVNGPETLQLLAKQMMLPRPAGSPPTGSLTDTLRESRYVMLAESFQQALSRPDLPEPFDWVKTLESGDTRHAIERWRTTKSLPWLTLALMYANGKEATSSELIQEADRILRSSPAFVTATYNALRLRIERGEREAPRAQLDKLLVRETTQPISVLNAWRAERMRVATSFNDFLRWAPRTPIHEYRPDDNSGSPVFANDSAYVLNFRAPVSMLAKAVHSDHLPAWSAADVAMAAWTRAFMLGDYAIMRDVAPVLAKSHPDWTAELMPPATPEFESWRFHAALLIARKGDFQPRVPVDYRNHVESNSWWCALSPPATNPQDGAEQNSAGQDTAWRLPAFFQPDDSVISKVDRGIAEKEITRLRQMGSAQSLIAPIILGWAKSHPGDPAVPEALHRVVMVVRYGCHEDPANGELSKSAFDLLHRRYPGSAWTTKTPYWFR